MKENMESPSLPKVPPKYLDENGKKLWKILVPYLNKNKEIIRADKLITAQYCSFYDTYMNAYDLVKKDGLQKKKYKTTLSPVDGSIVARDFTGYARNPAYQVMSDSLAKMNVIGKELGLSPTARNQLLNLKKPDDEDKKDSISIEEGLKKFLK